MCEKDSLVLSRDCIFQVLAAENDRVFMIISVLGKDDIKNILQGALWNIKVHTVLTVCTPNFQHMCELGIHSPIVRHWLAFLNQILKA